MKQSSAKKKVELLGLCADAPGSGKDTLFNLLAQDEPRLVNIKFSDQLTNEVAAMFPHLPIDTFLKMRHDPAHKDKPSMTFAPCMIPAHKGKQQREYVHFLTKVRGLIPWDPMSIRDHMVIYGTHFVREHQGLENRWLDLGLEAAKKAHEAGKIPVITDVRFPNEAARFKKIGGVLVKILPAWSPPIPLGASAAEGMINDGEAHSTLINPRGNPLPMKEQFYARYTFD